jgi:hypothetical protein
MSSIDPCWSCLLLSEQHWEPNTTRLPLLLGQHCTVEDFLSKLSQNLSPYCLKNCPKLPEQHWEPNKTRLPLLLGQQLTVQWGKLEYLVRYQDGKFSQLVKVDCHAVFWFVERLAEEQITLVRYTTTTKRFWSVAKVALRFGCT